MRRPNAVADAKNINCIYFVNGFQVNSGPTTGRACSPRINKKHVSLYGSRPEQPQFYIAKNKIISPSKQTE